MLKNQSFLLALGLGVACFFAVTAQAQTVGKQRLHGHRPEAVARFHLQPTGRLSATQRLNLAIGLPLRNQEELDNLLQQIYDPASPKFRQYLTPKQFTERFGPTEQDYQAVIDFAKTNGLTVTGTHPNRVVLDVSASLADIERVFHVTLHTYRHPSDARNFYAPDVEPSIDLAVPILQVSGLDDYSLPHPSLRVKAVVPATGVTPNSGSGPGSAYLGGDFRAAYVPDASLTGSGQSVALVQFDGYYSNDIAAYISQAGLTNCSVSLSNVPVNGGISVPGGGNVEVCLDIEMVIAMAPGVSNIFVYEAPNSPSSWPGILSRIANDNLAKQISCSWSGGGPNATAEETFKQMASQGQSFFNATGDVDAFTGSIPFPSDSTNITEVGGTVLTTTGPGGAYDSETVWNDRTPNPNGGNWGSSGGISPTYTIPIWQQDISMTTNQGSATMRNLPDVALTAKNVYVTYGNGSSGKGAGTSCAAPLWAGFTALVNELAANVGRPSVGFINPAIYAIGKGTNYTADFHDIVDGDNTWSGSPTLFYATSGYDLCTGWGTPVGQSLITALAIPDALGIVPASGFTANGVVGGPFDCVSQAFSLTNSGGSSLNWSLINTSVWLGASSGSGTLGAGSQTTVTIGLNAAASNLVAGIYPATLTFSNQNSHVPQNLLFTLQSGQSIVQNGGFETGDFNGWTLVGNTRDATFIYNTVADAGSFADNSGTNFIHSGTYGAFLGDNQIATLSQTLNTFPGQGYLLSFWLANPVSGSVQQFLVNWNTNSLATNQIYYFTNPPVLPWTNITMVVTATGTNATLQFGAENEPDGFGLDDVTLAPIPTPSFRTVAKTNNLLAFSWNSLAGVTYQLQFSTNLLTTNWVNLGAAINATNSIAATTNNIGPDRVRFYRMRRLP
jgi:subtilase family serine protease